ncbi:flagellar biosynthetic protein FliP [Flavimobilis soli]|uniref:Flagellar biosynthetic protein FliP n=1 Tax=Flavimobilis soli TaxID=442709 RepID=A0A2A9EGR7_9MICO|nr:flagellar type III secretion system pore protein FliP [Flavimobilis soli]PFG37432.1 flagellar biosynthetic protein FliP [Flavimobilis soli]
MTSTFSTAARVRASRGPAPREVAMMLGLVLLTMLAIVLAGVVTAPAAEAAPAAGAAHVAAPAAHVLPAAPGDPADPDGDQGTLSVYVDGDRAKPSSSVVVLLGMTVLSIAPALLLMMTSFTKIFVVLGLTRNALGLTNVPPNQVLAGLALFLSLFIMQPVLGAVNDAALQPYLDGSMDFTTAVDVASGPLRDFMLAHTREDDIALMTRISDSPNPETPASTPILTVIPAFMLSELRAAFIIGFVIFVPFLVIDLVVSSALMSMGMMMLPPVMISLPFKLLLFVLVDGWSLIITQLVGTYT